MPSESVDYSHGKHAEQRVFVFDFSLVNVFFVYSFFLKKNESKHVSDAKPAGLSRTSVGKKIVMNTTSIGHRIKSMEQTLAQVQAQQCVLLTTNVLFVLLAMLVMYKKTRRVSKPTVIEHAFEIID